MTWCKDSARDAAVRAAEDGRAGPLPTLGEAIASPFADAAERSSTVSETGEGQSGMRTERVTLEVTHGECYCLPEWSWATILRLHPGESVRVVEEPHFDDLAQVAMQRDAAISEREDLREQLESVACRAADAEMALQAASGGGEGEPVADANPFAWAVVEKRKDATWCYAFRSDKDQAQREFPPSEFFHFAVYRQPPQPRGWLTEEEHDIIAGIANDDEYTEEGQKIARGLLARSSPPEVVLPTVFSRSTLGDRLLVEQQVRQALAAAGVAVKEVGK